MFGFRYRSPTNWPSSNPRYASTFALLGKDWLGLSFADQVTIRSPARNCTKFHQTAPKSTSAPVQLAQSKPRFSFVFVQFGAIWFTGVTNAFLPWHARGRGFEPPWLHQIPYPIDSMVSCPPAQERQRIDFTNVVPVDCRSWSYDIRKLFRIFSGDAI